MTAINKTNAVDKLFEYGIDFRDKTIFLWPSEEINIEAAEYFCKGLLCLDKVRPQENITILLNSSGGEVGQGLAIYDMIRQCESSVHIKVIGEASSMAAWILQAGDYRSMSKHSSLMLHVGEEGYGSDHPNNIRSWVKYRDKIETPLLEDILLNRIRIKKPRFTRKQLRDMLLFDKVFTPEEALEYNLIDSIDEE